MTASEFPDFDEMRATLRRFNERAGAPYGPSCSDGTCDGSLYWSDGRVVCDECDRVDTGEA